VRDALNKALEKLPADRFESADEFKRALTDQAFSYSPKPRAPVAAGAGSSPGTKSWGRDTRTLLLLAAAVILAAALGWTVMPPGGTTAMETAAPAHRYAITDTLRSELAVTISRNGDVAYTATADGRTHLRLRRATDTWSTEIPNTTDAGFPSFSPRGDWIAFTVGQRELKKVQLATGTTVTLVPAGTLPRVAFTSWEDDGTILFIAPGGIQRVSDVGGQPEPLAEVGPGAVLPRLLPDGRTLLYTDMRQGNPANARIVAMDLVTGDTTTIASSGGNAVWSPTGHILHGHPSATIFAVPFDLRRRTVSGAPVPVQENVFSIGAVSFFTLSPTGSLAYLGGAGTAFDFSESRFAWLDRDGAITEIPIDPTDHADSRISPDGRHIAYTRGGYIYIFDLDRGTNQRLTFEGDNYHDPVWSPDGRRIAFTADRQDGRGPGDIYVKDVDGRSRAQWVAGFDGQQYPADWLEDGTLVFFSREQVGAQTDILMTRLGSDADPEPLLRADWDESSPKVSPDRRMLAYTSDETGQRHVFVREFPGMGGRWQVSARAAAGPLVWAREGNAIYYEDEASNRLVRADLEFEPTFQVLNRTEIVEQHVGVLRDVHPDGNRLLISRPLGADAMDDQEVQLLVVANWMTELRNRLRSASR